MLCFLAPLFSLEPTLQDYISFMSLLSTCMLFVIVIAGCAACAGATTFCAAIATTEFAARTTTGLTTCAGGNAATAGYLALRTEVAVFFKIVNNALISIVIKLHFFQPALLHQKLRYGLALHRL